jgi:DNA-binding FadR family transcriptional regulator
LSDKLTTTVPDAEYWPLDRRNVYAQIADQILWQIGSGHLKPGDVLPPERELTQSFAVGRSSVREALRILESQGVIRPVSGGAFVVAEAANPLNTSLRLLFKLDGRTGTRDLFELRRILDCEAAALAAERRTDEHLADMAASIGRMESALAVQTAGELFIDADLQFHLAVAEASGNRLLVYCMDAIRGVVQRALMTVYLLPQSPERAVIEHSRIRAAIESGERERARQEMQSHLDRVEADVQKGIGNG